MNQTCIAIAVQTAERVPAVTTFGDHFTQARTSCAAATSSHGYVAAATLHFSSAQYRQRSFASEASSDQTKAKPTKKGLSAGTVPPATEQVPLGSAQQKDLRPDSRDASDSLSSSARPAHKDSATVGTDRPSASAIPAGVDQVPPSSGGNAGSHSAQAASTPEDDSSTSSSTPQQSMQSVISDISDVGKLGTSSSTTSSDDSTTASGDSSQERISRWQRFKWWIWGTPQQYWTDQSSKQEQTSHGFGAASSNDTDTADMQPAQHRSKWLLGNIFESAIMRTGVIKDEDVARYKRDVASSFCLMASREVECELFLCLSK